jgi:cyclophilin family peptidyl-prolyl cis-trans isomerase
MFCPPIFLPFHKNDENNNNNSNHNNRHGKGPFYAQFFLKFVGSTDLESFVVEFPSLRELPHSVYTFLDLIESKLYDGTAFLFSANGVLRIGGSPSASNSARLAQRYKTHGYDESALLFVEVSNTYYCRKHSVGFVGRGPGLALYLSSSDSETQGREAPKTCLGRVVRGMKTLSHVEAAIDKGQVVDIVEVKHLKLDESHDKEL